MHKPTYTPGPWKVEQDLIVSVADRDGDWPVIAKEDRTSIAENWAADARLIAAAPEMLGALYLVWNSIDRVNHPAAKAVQHAIAKAEGHE